MFGQLPHSTQAEVCTRFHSSQVMNADSYPKKTLQSTERECRSLAMLQKCCKVRVAPHFAESLAQKKFGYLTSKRHPLIYNFQIFLPKAVHHNS